jgi:CheY-like chemotaxis protein
MSIPLPHATGPRAALATDGPSVLVVESDELQRGRLGTWLAAEGLVVLYCPGPTAPDYSCVGTRTGECPLVEAAAAVVLDVRLESDLIMEGASSFDLLSYYRSRELPLVLLADAEDGVGLLAEPGVEVLVGPVQREALIGSIRRAMAGGDPEARLDLASGQG